MNERSLESSIDIDVPPEAAYQAYADVAHWADWDPDTRAAALDGAPVDGTRGWLRPRKGLKVKMVVLRARPALEFTVMCPVLGSRMVFEHLIVRRGAGVRVCHRVSFEGWLAGWLMRSVGADLRSGLPHTLQSLKAHLERGGTPAG